ncbi:hypothetical protein DDP54_00440 (plasmid) [Cellulomonas sp. WB94]|nr:hypothetical protein DDP54_00440 [Cellulomonas sp. WB94]
MRAHSSALRAQSLSGPSSMLTVSVICLSRFAASRRSATASPVPRVVVAALTHRDIRPSTISAPYRRAGGSSSGVVAASQNHHWPRSSDETVRREQTSCEVVRAATVSPRSTTATSITHAPPKRSAASMCIDRNCAGRTAAATAPMR